MIDAATQASIVRVLNQIGNDMVGKLGDKVLSYLTRLDDTEGMMGGFYEEYALPKPYGDTFLMVMSDRAGEIGLFLRLHDPSPKAKKYCTVLHLTNFEACGDGMVMGVCDAEALGKVMSNAVCHHHFFVDVVAVIVGYLMMGDEPKELTLEDKEFLKTLFFWPQWNANQLEKVAKVHARTPDKLVEKMLGNIYLDLPRELKSTPSVSVSGNLLLQYGGLTGWPNVVLELVKNEHGEPFEIKFIDVDGCELPEPYSEFYKACFTHNGYNIFDW